MNDDFLKEFQKAPSDEFGQSLLASLRQLDAAENESPVTAKSPLVILPAPRRSRDRYLSWIASLTLLFFFSSVLFLNVRKEEVPNSAQSLNIASMTGLSQLAWSPDGRLLYASDESQIYRLNLRLQLVDSWPLNLDGSVTAMQFVDNYLLLGDSSGKLSIWFTETMQKLETFPVHDGALEVLAYLPNRQLILSSGADGELVSLSLRGSQLNEISRLSLGSEMQIRGFAVHPDEQQLIATSSNAVTLVYAIREDGSLMASSAYGMSSFPPNSQADFMMNGQFMTLLWWDTLRVVDSQTLAERYHYSLPEPYLWLSPLQSASNRLLLVNPRGLLGIWDFTGESYLEIYRSSTSHPLQAALHPEGQLVAAITLADELRLWRVDDASDGSMSSSEVAVNRPSSNQPQNAAPLVLAPLEEDFSQIREIYHFGDGFLLETLWSPDGSILMLSSTSTIRLYDAELNFFREWSVLGMELTVTAFSPDGRYLLTGSSTGTLAVWDVLTGRNLATMLVGEKPLVFLAFLNGGSRILSRDATGEFVLMNFDGSQLTLQTRSQQAALASWTIQDWQSDGNNVQLLMARNNSQDFLSTALINLIELSLGDTITAEAASTGITGNLARFVSQGRILIYEQREHFLHLYQAEGMVWQDTLEIPVGIASLNYLAYDARHERVFLLDYDRSLSSFNLEDSSIQPIENTSALLEQAAHSLALHPSGDMAAVISSYNRVAIWEFTDNRAEEIANDSPVLGQIRSFVTGSGDIAAASSSDGSVLLFNSSTGNLLRRLDLGTWGILNHDLRFNADNTMLAVLGQDVTGVDSILNVIDVQAAINGESDFHIESSPFIFENQYLSGLAFNSFGDTLITGGSEVRRWPLSIDEASGWLSAPNLRGLTIFAHHPRLGEVATLRPGNYLLVLETSLMNERYLSRFYGRSLPSNTFLEYSHDGNYIIMVGDGAAPQIFNSQTSELLASLDNLGVTSFNAIALSDDYLYLAADVGIYVVNIEAVLLDPNSFLILPYNATQIALSADGKRLFYLGRDGMVRVLGLPED